MLLSLIAAHLIIAMGAPMLGRRLGREAFWLGALPAAVAFSWLVGQAPLVLSGGAYVEAIRWIPALGVELTFRLGLLQWILGLIVTGIGALILVYCRWYFERGATRCFGLLTAFAGAMLGLVTADDLVVMYVFWELTTVFSYLLIGNDSTRRANRSAALTALIVTTTGGLAMLVGIIVLGSLGGSYSLAALVDAPPTGTLAGVAALLLLVGALSKSALAPFHFWLPGAMAAPTPVSAYLHAAAMVKAGIYLTAALAPAFAGVPGWRATITVLGVATMILGGWRSLRQTDLKLLLAYGTVSQLGFIMLLVGLGTRAAALAGVAMLVAHALFKSTLFLTVGVIDHATGTRDLRELSGVGRRLPVLAAAAGLASASMAGLPPLLGFISKEGALEALVYLTAGGGDGTALPPGPSVLLVIAVVLGSTLTMAYSLRFWWGAFWRKPGVAPTAVDHRPEAGFLAVPVVLGLACLVGGFVGPTLTDVFTPYAEQAAVGEPSHGLALWHGLTAPLGLSAIAVLGGALLFLRRDVVASAQSTFPSTAAADEIYRRTMRGLDWLAVEVTARTQRGSLSWYLATILVVVVAGVGGALLALPSWSGPVRLADSPAQIVVAAVVAIAAVTLVFVRGRIRAVLTLGVTGYGTALLFLQFGAPDLALTQVLVETASLLVFLLVLRTLPKYFTDRPLHSTRWWRALLAVAVGATVTLLSIATAWVRTAPPASTGLDRVAYEFGYGKNIVNVILVDTRAWDTLGELSVLIVAATGVASLIFLRSRIQNVSRIAPDQSTSGHVWLRGSRGLDTAARSLVFEVVTRLLFGITMMISIYVLVAGHNLPGGGFAGGLIAGLALVVRYLAAGRHELDEAAPVDAGHVLGAGLLIAVASALLPTAFGGRIFQSYEAHVTIPALESIGTPWGPVELLGDIHLVSSTLFDVGVYLIVLGMVLDLVRSLGSGIDQHAEEHLAPLPKPESTYALPFTAWGNDR